MKNINIIGERFSRLIVLKQDGHYKNGTKLYICRCDCGGECQTSLSHLRNEEVKSCGCLVKETSSQNGKLGKIDLLNQKFDRLVVVAQHHNTKYGIMWLCQCDCGNKTIVSGVNLRRKIDGTKSCGCLSSELAAERGKKRRSSDPWKVEMIGFQAKNAKIRDLLFELTIEQYKELVLSPCHYCGDPPSMKCYSVGLIDDLVVKNGIDRIDSNIGYIISNCVSCCLPCNLAKMDMSYKDFIENTKKRFYFLVSKGIIKLETNYEIG